MWEPKNKNQLINDHKKRVPLKELKQKHGGTTDKIRGFLQREGCWVPYKSGKVLLPADNVIALYKQDWTPKQIAEYYQVSVGPINDILDKSQTRKPVWAKQLPYQTYVLLNNQEYFQSKVEELVSKKDVADHFGVGIDMISSLMKKYGISSLSSGMVRSVKNRQTRGTVPFTKKDFIEQHFTFNKSIQSIAELMGVSVEFLRSHISKWGVHTRDTRISLKFRKFKTSPTKQIQKIVNETPVTVLFKQYDVSYDTFRAFLQEKKINIPQRFISQGEKIIGDFIESHGIVIEKNNRTLIYPYEVDIYAPSHNIAIEYCGLYWHSELNNRGKSYHLNKRELCAQRGIRLITIFEDEFFDHPEIVYSKILSVFNKHQDREKINARECEVREITQEQKRVFLNANHIQGNDRSRIRLGLFNANKLVAVMTFARPSRVRASREYMKDSGLWELNRFATDITKNVRGAAGKLLSHFKKHYQWTMIYSYADKRWSEGDLYHQLGFDRAADSPPNYWYVPKGYYKREYRYNYTKYKLVEEGYDKNKSESQIMKERGFTRIWDCGHFKFEMTQP